MRGTARRFRGNFEKAEADFTAAIERGWKDVIVYALRAIASVRLGRLEEAQRDRKRANELAPEYPCLHGCWGNLHLASEYFNEAIDRFRLVRDAEPDIARTQFDLGAALLLGGRFGEAMAAYEAGVADPESDEVEAALRDLNFWVTQKADRLTSTEAQDTIARIREVLEARRSQLRSAAQP